LINRSLSKLKEERFIDNELLIIIPNLFLFASLFIVGHFLNFYLVLISIAFSNIGLLIGFIIWSLLGSPTVPYKAISGWAGFNFGIKTPWFSLVNQGISTLMLVAYPIAIGIYFFKPLQTANIGLITLECTLILILASYCLLMPTVISVLTANFIDEDTRSRYLISQFSNLIPNSLFISLLFWVLNIGKTGHTYTLQNVSATFNPLLFGVLMVIFLCFFLLPYFIGIQRAKQLKSDYFDQQDDILHHLSEAIDLSTPKNIGDRLQGIEDLIKTKYFDLKNENIAIETGLTFDATTPDKIPANEAFIYNCYREAKAYDKRFIYFNFLDDTFNKITELKDEVTNEPDTAINKETLQKYATYFKDKRKEASDINDKKGSSNPALWIGIIALLSPFISQLMTDVGKYLIEYFKKM
jgi:hypothetical protein